jgi:hypothetical protein
MLQSGCRGISPINDGPGIPLGTNMVVSASEFVIAVVCVVSFVALILLYVIIRYLVPVKESGEPLRDNCNAPTTYRQRRRQARAVAARNARDQARTDEVDVVRILIVQNLWLQSGSVLIHVFFP